MKDRVIPSAVFLIDQPTLGRSTSSFDYDPRGYAAPAKQVSGGHLCTSAESAYDDAFTREIRPVSKGKLGLFFSFDIMYGESFIYELSGKGCRKTTSVLTLTAKDGFLCVNGKKLPLAVESRHYAFYATLDLDGKTAAVSINDECFGNIPLGGSLITCFTGRALAHGDTCIRLGGIYAYINYALCDRPFDTAASQRTALWQVSGNGQYTFERRPYCEGNGVPIYALDTVDGEAVTVSRVFDKIKGKICFEYTYLLRGENEHADVTLAAGKKAIVTVRDTGAEVSAAGKTVFTHHKNVFQTLRIEADTADKTALIKINGKAAASVPFENAVNFADNIRITYRGAKGGTFKFVDVYAFEIPAEPADYVPEIVKPEKLDYILGMNICSLWREGSHFGWDNITPYEENKTYLGYYDEGLPETSDWEIKWMAEHGLDFGLYCWYNNMRSAPIFRTHLSDALENGHFHAKYADYLKFAILFEAVNGAPVTPDSFRTYVVPYWIDHYFCDRRYMTIDNKALVAVFGVETLISQLGSPEQVKKAFDFLNEAVKDIGLDGVIMTCCGGVTEARKACGFTAAHAYSWAQAGCEATVNIESVRRLQNERLLPYIPTVSTGFNSIAWHHKRFGQLEPSAMGEVLTVFKNELLANNKDCDAWLNKTVMFSTWNEYGEGTFMCPSNLHGFDYLDEIRKAFTTDTPHTDARPDENQLSRIGYLYPNNRGILRAHQTAKSARDYHVIRKLSLNAADWKADGPITFRNDEKGHIIGEVSAFDPKLFYQKWEPISSKEVAAIRLCIRGTDVKGSGGYVEIFFQTDDPHEGNVWTPSKGFKFTASPDNVQEYIIPVNECTAFAHTVTAFRIDPLATTGTFAIEAVELLADDTLPLIFIDGEYLPTPVAGEIIDGKIYIPYTTDFPQSMLRHAHIWRRDTRELILRIHSVELLFKVGSKYVVINGEKVPLDRRTWLFDGLPMIDLEVVCRACGFGLSRTGREFHVTTKQ